MLVKSKHGHFFARLLHLFQIQVDARSHTLAYVESYCRPPGTIRRKDKDLGLYRLHKKAEQYEIISLESVIRGALLVPDPDVLGEYFVVDTIDADMFLRMKNLTL